MECLCTIQSTSMSTLSNEFLYDWNIMPLIKKFNTFPTLNKVLDIFRERNNVAGCDYIIKKGADNLYDNLYIACQNGQLDVVILITKENLKVPLSCLKIACENGHTEIVKYLFNSGYVKVGYRYIRLEELFELLRLACKSGVIDCVEFLFTKGALDLTRGIKGACEGGYEHIIYLLFDIQKSLKSGLTQEFLSSALVGACIGGHEKIVNRMLDECEKINPLEGPMFVPIEGACLGGNFKVACHMFKLLSKRGNFSIDSAFNNACLSGNMDIIKMTIEHAQNNNQILNWDVGLNRACDNGHIHVVRYMLELGASDLNDGFKTACFRGHFEIIQLLVSRARHINYALKWYRTFVECCKVGDFKILEFLYNNGDFNRKHHKKALWPCIRNACEAHHIDVVKWLIPRFGHKFSAFKQGMTQVCENNNGDIYMARYLINHLNQRWETAVIVRMIKLAYKNNQCAIGELLLERIESYIDTDHLFNYSTRNRVARLLEQLLLKFPDRFEPPKIMSLRSFKKQKTQQH